jgi:hypothetical protein
MTIKLFNLFGAFAEDKTRAREVRLNQILPALAKHENIILDFQGIKYATQSFIHALIFEALHEYGEATLDRLEFRHCTEEVRIIIEIVVNYYLNPPVQEVTS